MLIPGSGVSGELLFFCVGGVFGWILDNPTIPPVSISLSIFLTSMRFSIIGVISLYSCYSTSSGPYRPASPFDLPAGGCLKWGTADVDMTLEAIGGPLNGDPCELWGFT